MILDAFGKALAQAFDPRFRRVLLLGVGLTLAILVAFGAMVMWLLSGWLAGGLSLPFIGEVAWLDNLVGWGSLIALVVVSGLLMVPVASAMTSLFLDQVAQAVEDRHYPHVPPAQPVGLVDGLRDTVSFLGVLILANLLALILYLIFAPFALFIFWGLNGFLLGREYFTLVAMRRVGRAGAKSLRKRYFGTIWLAGTLMAVPLTVPLVNLVIPILGAATFTHIYHMKTARPA